MKNPFLKRSKGTLAVIILCISFTQCREHTQHPFVIETQTKNPWTHLNFIDESSQFQFAIVSDRTGGMRAGIFEKAIAKLNLLHPEFVMSVGDLIVGWDYEKNTFLRDSTKTANRWREFKGITDKLKAPFFYVGGNNDFRNARTTAEWVRQFGRTYYRFLYKEVLFIVLNSDDTPGESMGGLSEEQLAWLQQTLDSNREVRWTLLFLHRPFWLDDPPVWDRVETILENRPRTVFAGHWHKYWQTEINGYQYYILATTGGTSPLKGPLDGTFDHITWVTMTHAGPKIANILLDGILGENPMAEALPGQELTSIIKKQGITKAVAKFREIRAAKPDAILFGESAMATLGYEFLAKDRIPEAIQVFQLNAETYSNSFQVYAALGDAYFRAGARDKAIANYQNSLALNPNNRNAVNTLQRLQSYTDQQPAVSPDGKVIAFSSDRDGNREIYRINIDGTGTRRLTNSAAFDVTPAWAPDGSKLIWHSTLDNRHEIFIMNPDGAGQKQLTESAENFGFLAWSPVGEKIAYTSAREGNHEIYVMNADGTRTQRLTNHAANDKVAVWSPDGQRLAFQSDRSGDAEIYVMQADGSDPHRLTHHDGPDRVFAWSAFDGKLYFDSQRQGKWDIYVMNSDGTGQTNLTNDARSSWYPSLPTKNSFIVFGRERGDGESSGLWIMDLDGGNQRPVAAAN